MARRCLCARLLASAQEDPRLRTLPLAARMLFLLVAEAAMRGEVPGVLPFSGAARVALLVSASETEVETHLRTLIAEGLLKPTDAGGLAVPLLAEAASRAEVARRNGAAGGRPRKGESREEYLRRRQQSLLLPVGGGAAGETRETQPAEPAAPPTTTSNSSTHSVSGGGSPRPAREGVEAWVSLGTELAEIAGLDGSRGGFDFRPVQGWMRAGASAEAIRDAVRSVVQRPGYDPRRVWSLNYFNSAVTQAAERVVAPRPARDTADEAALIAATEARIAAALGRPVAAA